MDRGRRVEPEALRLLLDETVAPRVARELRRDGVDAQALRELEDGRYLGADDLEVLRAARGEGRALVTYDVRTMPDALRAMAEAGEQHAGVVLVSARTVPQDAVGALTSALRKLAGQRADLSAVVLFLQA